MAGELVPDWEEKTRRAADHAKSSQVIKFKRTSPSGGEDMFFLMTFTPGLRDEMESTFAKQRSADQAELDKRRAHSTESTSTSRR